tara:strand:- start:17277 stop:18569 length:1293 start_codon:yes stop_codon:yes gene_type:complete
MDEIKFTELEKRLLVSGETIGKMIDKYFGNTIASKIEVGDYLRVEIIKPRKQARTLERMKELPPEMVNKILLAEHNLCSLDWNRANDRIKTKLRIVLQKFRTQFILILKNVFDQIPIENDHGPLDEGDTDDEDEEDLPVDKYTLQFSVRPNHVPLNQISAYGVTSDYFKKHMLRTRRHAEPGKSLGEATLAFLRKDSAAQDLWNPTEGLNRFPRPRNTRYGYHLLSTTTRNKIIPDHHNWPFRESNILDGEDAGAWVNPYWYDSRLDDDDMWPWTEWRNLAGMIPSANRWPTCALQVNGPYPVDGNEEHWLKFLQQIAESELYNEPDRASDSVTYHATRMTDLSLYQPDYVLTSLVDRDGFKIMEFEYNLIATSRRASMLRRRSISRRCAISRKHVKNLKIIKGSLLRLQRVAKTLCQETTKNQFVLGVN